MAGVTWGFFLSIGKLVLRPIIRTITPIIEEELEKALTNLHKKALATDNPWDDLLTGLVLDLFDIEYSEK